MGSLTLSKLNKAFGSIKVLHDIDLSVEDGEFVVFVGPSGCGKSTLLRVIAGLEDATSGTVDIAGQVVNSVPPSKRGIAMVFQTYALYPHLTVEQNMALGLKQAGTARDVINSQITRAADMLELGPYLQRRPAELSGGQRQRVAIGRAITRNPELFLFDEPLSNLDAALRVNTRLEIARLHQELRSTIIYVTHDQVEAMTLADKIVVLRDGRIEQVGSPMELYNRPANRFVAGFIGSPAMNFLTADQVALPSGVACVGLRPEAVSIHPDGQLEGVVSHLEQLGSETNIYLRVAGELVTVRENGQSSYEHGSTQKLHFAPETAHYFDAEGTRIEV